MKALQESVALEAPRAIDTWQTVTAAVLMSAASAAIFLLLPMLIGSMVDDLGLSEQQAGYTVSSYFAGYMLVCLSGYFWIRQVNWRRLAMLGYGLLLAGLLTCGWSNANMLLVSMFVAGVGAGILLGLGVTVISDMTNPDRIFGLQMLAQQALPASLLFALPALLPADASFAALTTTIALVLAATAIAALGIPTTGRKQNTVRTLAFRWRLHWRVVVVLVAIGLYFTALSAVWAFVERVADARGIIAEDIGRALAIALVGGAMGGIVAAVIAGRCSRAKVLLASSLTFLLVFWGYNTAFDLALFVLISVAFSFSWNVCMAFQQGLMASLDTGGRFMVLVPASISAGAMLGPAVGGLLVGSGGYTLLLGVMGVALVVFTVPFLICPAAARCGVGVPKVDIK